MDSGPNAIETRCAALSGLGKEDEAKRFDTFNVDLQEDSQAAAMLLSTVHQWASSEAPRGQRWLPWLVILGPPGIGKTHLAIAAMWRIAARRGISMYVNGATLGDTMRNFEDNAADNFKSSMVKADWLVIDDIGAAYDPNSYIAGTIHDVLTRRYERAAPTLMTSNLTEDQLKCAVDRDDLGRIYSRMSDVMVSRVVDVTSLTSVRGVVR